jgi:hypothetical protein
MREKQKNWQYWEIFYVLFFYSFCHTIFGCTLGCQLLHLKPCRNSRDQGCLFKPFYFKGLNFGAISLGVQNDFDLTENRILFLQFYFFGLTDLILQIFIFSWNTLIKFNSRERFSNQSQIKPIIGHPSTQLVRA